jgi:hypothetical protein
VALDLFAAGTYCRRASARTLRDITFCADERGQLLLDAYLPLGSGGRSPAVLLDHVLVAGAE